MKERKLKTWNILIKFSVGSLFLINSEFESCITESETDFYNPSKPFGEG